MAKARKTLVALFASPIRLNIAWNDLLSMLGSFGAAIATDVGGSMHSVTFKGRTIVLHKPHPGSEIPPAMVRRVRQFLRDAGVQP